MPALASAHEHLLTGGSAFSDDHAMATDISDTDLICRAGTFLDTVDFSGTILTSTGSFPDAYLTVARPGSPGLATSIKGVGAFDAQIEPVRVILDGNYVYLIGYVQGTLEYAPSMFLSSIQAAFANTFIIKYAIKETGLFPEWGRIFNGHQRNLPFDAALDGNGVLWVVGYFEATVSFRPGEAPIGDLTSVGGWDGYTAQLNPNGTPALVARRLGGPGEDAVTSIAFDANNYSFIGGYFSETANVDMLAAVPAATLTSTDFTDGFLVRRNPSEGFESLEHFQCAGPAKVTTLALREFDDVIIGGEFSHSGLSMTTPGFSLSGEDAANAFVARRTYGVVTHLKGVQGVGNGFANRVVANKCLISLGGSFTGRMTFGGGFTLETPGDFDGFLWTLTETLETEGFRHVRGPSNGEVRDVALKSNGWVSAVGSFRSDTDFQNGVESNLKLNGFDTDFFQWFAYPAPLPAIGIEPFSDAGVVLSFTPRCGHDFLIEESPDLINWPFTGTPFVGGSSPLFVLMEYPPGGPTQRFFRLHALSTTELLALP